MSRAIQPQFIPSYGSGAPGGSVPKNTVYFDTSTTPYTPYIFFSGAWHSFGGGSAGSNATSLQGVPVSATPPSLNQILQYNGTNWAPANSGAATPTIIQSGGTTVNANSSITLGAAPTRGNLLVALVTHFSTAQVPGTGWAQNSTVPGSSNDGYGIYTKLVGAGESATQQPQIDSSTGSVVIWEINGATGIDVFGGQHDLTSSPTATQSVTTSGANELVLCSFATATNNVNLPTGVSYTSDGTNITGGTRAVNWGHFAQATPATFNLTATWAVNTPFADAYIALF